MSDNILEMRHIGKEFFGVKALDEVNFIVKRGEIHAICGENGAGKSTLMNILSGVYPYGTYAGEVVYNGEVCRFKSIKESEKKKIVIIHQELTIIPLLSVAENIFIGNENLTLGGWAIDWDKTRQKAKQVLEMLGETEINVDRPAGDFGMGYQQLFEIAKALAKEVELLILDEPTSALNEQESQRLLQLILSLKERGITCIMISHKLNEVSQVADNITILRDGKTIETIPRKNGIAIDENRIIKGMVGREITERYPQRDAEIGEIVFEVKGWTVYDEDEPTKKRLNDVSFNVRRGEVVGIAGLSGAGRTELAMSLFGHCYGVNSSGVILKDGEEITIPDVRSAIDQKIVYVPEDRKNFGLVLMHDLVQNMTLASLKERFSSRSIIKKEAEIKDAEIYCGLINLKANSIYQKVESLSGGNQQKVVLAKWMLTNADVFILDEPTRGIDVRAKYEVYCIINQLAEIGKAIIVISSEMPELIGICDRAYILNEGEIAGEVQKSDMSQEGIMKIIMDHTAKRKKSVVAQGDDYNG